MECRICLEGSDTNTMVRPCMCRGSAEFVHQRCLDLHLRHYPDGACRVCLTPMNRHIRTWDITPAIVFAYMGCSIWFCDAVPLAKFALFVALSGLAWVYWTTMVVTRDLFFLATLIVYSYSHFSVDFGLTLTFYCILMTHTAINYVPMPYLAILAIVAVTGGYFMLLSYAMSLDFNGISNGVLNAIFTLVWICWVRMHPVPRLE